MAGNPPRNEGETGQDKGAPQAEKRRKTGEHHKKSQDAGRHRKVMSRGTGAEERNEEAPNVKDPFMDMAYKGNFKGAIWNAQGLCTRCPKKHEARWKRVQKLLRKNDFVMISETHSNPGKADAENVRLKSLGIKAFLSHGSNHRAGVAILINQKFLDKFNSQEPVWGEIQKGEAAVLQLQGAEGNLDLFSIYMPTGNAGSSSQDKASLLSQRHSIRQKMANCLKSPVGALSIIGGDFNYVAGDKDRWTLAKGDWSNTDNAADQKDFLAKMGPQSGMHELHQEHATHRSGIAQSRIDRIYLNQHCSEQLDSALGCAALEWDTELSDHRPIIFFRRRRKKESDERIGPLPIGPMQNPRWPERVRALFHQLSSEVLGTGDPLHRLQLLKDAIGLVTKQMEAEEARKSAGATATETDDQLGWTIKFIRAAEEDRKGGMKRCKKAYPFLNALIDAKAKDIRIHGGLQKVRDHAIELHRTQILEEMRFVQSEEGSASEDLQRNRKSRIQAKLQRLKPGTANTIAVLLCANGQLATDAKSIAKELHRHWHITFQAKPMDEDLLQKWLREEIGDNGPFQNNSTDLEILPEDLQKAIKNAPATMPGPDGIPYLAWKKLGILGADCLFNAAKALGQQDAGSRLINSDSGAGPSNHRFNVGNMVFLPKKVGGLRSGAW